VRPVQEGKAGELGKVTGIYCRICGNETSLQDVEDGAETCESCRRDIDEEIS
jgi:hypothetical protein